MRKIPLTTNEYYHIYNRGAEKRKIFLQEKDYSRFLLGAREFNDVEPKVRLSEIELQAIKNNKNPLVEIVCCCLMPNHWHFILKQIQDDGISKFVHKLTIGHAMYFNTKYEREGRLYQGTFKAIHIENDAYLLHLSRYIHLNPVELIQHDWKEVGIKNKEEAARFLRNYKWSSHPLYIGGGLNETKSRERDLVSVGSNNIILGQIGGKREYENFVLSWLEKEMLSLGGLTIE